MRVKLDENLPAVFTDVFAAFGHDADTAPHEGVERSNAMTAPYDIIIGLEVHVQLLARSKMFCGCDTTFGAPPNTQTCPVCIGLPGSLPVMNRHAFELSLKTAVALNCRIPRFTKWDRKNYYYPDLPKGYQISQYDLPLSEEGYLEIEVECGSGAGNAVGKGDSPQPAEEPAGQLAEKGTVPFSNRKRIGIIRAHLEEDAGKSMHDECGGGKGDSPLLPERPGGCFAQKGTVPFSAAGKADSRIEIGRAHV